MNPKENNPFAKMDASLAALSSSVRKRGLQRLLVGSLGMALVFGIIFWGLPRLNLQLGPGGLMTSAIPGGLALVGMVECISGVSYRDLASRWDSLKGWQRGLLGLLLVCVAMVVFMGIAFLFIAP